MAFCALHTRAEGGYEAPLVKVEVHLSNGLPGFSVVGLPAKAVKESKERVRSALLNCGYRMPSKRIIVNLAPADLPKAGGRFDLAIAVAILLASKQCQCEQADQFEVVGELELSGQVRPIQGLLVTAIASAQAGKVLVAPLPQCDELFGIEGLRVIGVDHLCDIAQVLQQPPQQVKPRDEVVDCWFSGSKPPCLSQVVGQESARQALMVAAAGGHHCLMVGSPGAGKSLLAHCIEGILPGLSTEQALETACCYDLSADQSYQTLWGRGPFWAPHHPAGTPALIGGGQPPGPGEISLAHHGVLFLDELPEFRRDALEALREPIESGWITLSRAGATRRFPARFQLLAAMNPCPCGYANSPTQTCQCRPEQITRYQAKLSGPLLDRIDLVVICHPISPECLMKTGEAMPSSQVLAQVTEAQSRQYRRQGCLNAHLCQTQKRRLLSSSINCQTLLEQISRRLQLSTRALFRLLLVARTLADCKGDKDIDEQHVAEALCFYRKSV